VNIGKSRNKLFSVACISFNQENIVNDCLDSIFNQTYKNIELVICDDCSKDSTPKVIEEWIKNKGSRFENVVFLKNKKNMGISASHDIALKNTHGEYIKYIAGDDVLLEVGVSEIARFLEETGASWGQCVVNEFYPGFSHKREVQRPYNRFWKYFRLDAKDQFRMLCRENFFCAPGNFFRRNVLESIGFLDTSFRFFEDWHTWLRLTKMGFKFSLLPIPLVLWRRHNESVSFSAMDLGNIHFFLDSKRTIEKYILPDFEILDWLTKRRVTLMHEYYSTLIQNGGTKQSHSIARKVKLRDPLWWLDLPYYLQEKLKK